jgi:hypothetical protein
MSLRTTPSITPAIVRTGFLTYRNSLLLKPLSSIPAPFKLTLNSATLKYTRSKLKLILRGLRTTGSRRSSVSIVSDYGLDDRAFEVRSSAGTKDFSSSLCVQTGSGAHPASCPMGTGGPSPGSKARPGCDANHSRPSSAEVMKE